MTPPLGQEVLTFEGQELGFVVNGAGRGIIDVSSYFDTENVMAGGPAAWRIDEALRVEAIILHHWAGWYGPRLDARATAAQEFEQLVACARDHHARFGIGPGYNVIVFPSGRAWAVGKHGTHRAHTIGRNPESGAYWNTVGRAICAAGNYEEEPVGPLLAEALRRAVDHVRTWPGVLPDAPVHEHGLTPTVNAAGVMFSQGTACPGRNIAAWRAAGGLNAPPQTDRFEDGRRLGRREGYDRGVADSMEAARRVAEGLTSELQQRRDAPPEEVAG
jgi:N-acetylmuramoyl-L-alanine amidase